MPVTFRPHLLARRDVARLAGALLLLVPALWACARDEPAAAARKDELVVFAASSLRDAFGKLGAEFERLRPDVDVTFNFAGTQELRTQLEHGAPADVFASADQRHMDELVRAGRTAEVVVFAHNEPVIVVAKDAGSQIRGLADLPEAARIVVGAAEVPIGRYTVEILERATATLGADFRARVEAKVVSRELNVRQVLAKVRLGEARAAIVYRTDALAAPELEALSIPAELNVIATYPIAVAKNAARPDLARAWIAYVLSDAGQRALEQAGFARPSAAR